MKKKKKMVSRMALESRTETPWLREDAEEGTEPDPALCLLKFLEDEKGEGERWYE